METSRKNQARRRKKKLGDDNNLPALVEVENDIGLFPETTHPKKRAYLAAFAQVGAVHLAGQFAGVDWRNHYHWLHKDPVYAEAFAYAKELAADSAENEIVRRGFHGATKPVTYKGKVTDTYQECSDILAIFHMKKIRPEYRDSFNLSINSTPKSLAIIYPAATTHPPNSIEIEENGANESDATLIKD